MRDEHVTDASPLLTSILDTNTARRERTGLA